MAIEFPRHPAPGPVQVPAPDYSGQAEMWGMVARTGSKLTGDLAYLSNLSARRQAAIDSMAVDEQVMRAREELDAFTANAARDQQRDPLAAWESDLPRLQEQWTARLSPAQAQLFRQRLTPHLIQARRGIRTASDQRIVQKDEALYTVKKNNLERVAGDPVFPWSDSVGMANEVLDWLGIQYRNQVISQPVYEQRKQQIQDLVRERRAGAIATGNPQMYQTMYDIWASGMTKEEAQRRNIPESVYRETQEVFSKLDSVKREQFRHTARAELRAIIDEREQQKKAEEDTRKTEMRVGYNTFLRRFNDPDASTHPSRQDVDRFIDQYKDILHREEVTGLQNLQVGIDKRGGVTDQALRNRLRGEMLRDPSSVTRESITRHLGKGLNTDDAAALLKDLDEHQTDPLGIMRDDDYRAGKEYILTKFGLTAQFRLPGDMSSLLNPANADRLANALFDYYQEAKRLRQANQPLHTMPMYAKSLVNRRGPEGPTGSTGGGGSGAAGTGSPSPTPSLTLPPVTPKTGRKPGF